MAGYAHDHHEVPLPGHRVRLGHPAELGQGAPQRLEGVALGFDQDDGVGHPAASSAAPPGPAALELPGQLEADGHADEHADPRLLGDQPVDGLPALGRVLGLGRRAAHLVVVRRAEPPALGQGRVEHAGQARAPRG